MENYFELTPGFIFLCILSFFVFSLNLKVRDCPFRFQNKHLTSFFCYKDKVNLNCIDEKHLEEVLYITLGSRKKSTSITGYILKHGLANLNELDKIKGIGPVTIKKLSDYFVSGTCD